MKSNPIIDGFRVCNECKVNKPVDSYTKKCTVKSGIRSQCKECVSIKGKEYYQIPEVKQRFSDYAKKEEVKERAKVTQVKTRKKRTVRYHTDELYKTACKIRNGITKSFTRTKTRFNKNSKTAQILGLSFNEVHTYLNETFVNRYGRLPLPEDKTEIDHIIPISTAKTSEEIEKLNHYTNLQLLTREDNVKKSNKLNWDNSHE